MKNIKHAFFWAVLSITIPNAVVNRSTTAFCSSYNYQPIINGSSNPETPIQFTQRMIAQFIKATVIGYESQQAGQTAQQNQQTQTTSDVSGIQ